MGSGGYVICELNAVQKEFPEFQRVFAELEREAILRCTRKWFAKKAADLGVERAAAQVFGGLTPTEEQFGRTTILPALFDDNTGTQMVTWRQYFASTGHQTLITGTRAGNRIPEDFKVAWIGLAFPNEQVQISEIKFQIGDTKYGRINLEEIDGFNVPAVIFEKGFIIDEEQSFELQGYVKQADYQRIVMLGALYYKNIDDVLGAPGSTI